MPEATRNCLHKPERKQSYKQSRRVLCFVSPMSERARKECMDSMDDSTTSLLPALLGAAARPSESVLVGQTDEGAYLEVSHEHFERHTVVFGASGYGKTYFSYLVAKAQIEQGCSVVALDPKKETIRALRGACEQAGVPAERVVTIDASDPASIPGMNPFRTGNDPAETVAEMLGLFPIAENAPRVKQFLTHAVTLAAWHGRSLREVPELLWDDALRETVLASATVAPPDEVYEETERFFRRRFPSLSTKDREGSILALETRFTELLGNRLFLRMLNAEQNTVDFASLFREPGAVLATLGKGGGLSPDGRKLLGGLLIHLLDAASARRPGDRPVVLWLDEVGAQSRLIADSLRDIVNLARQRKIRLLFAAQHPGQLPESLRQDVLESSAVKAFFHAGGDSARATAQTLAEYDEEEEDDGYEEIAPYRGRLYAWSAYTGGIAPLIAGSPPPFGHLYVDTDDPGDDLQRFCRYAAGARPPALLEDGTLARDAFSGLPAGSVRIWWDRGEAWAEVRPPQREPPRKTNWAAVLRRLEVGEAVVTIGTSLPQVLQVSEVALPQDASPAYVEASRRATAAPRTVQASPPPGKAPVSSASEPAQIPTQTPAQEPAQKTRVRRDRSVD